MDNWSKVIYSLGVGILAYAAIVVLLRISGKRTLSKWNSFDFVITIAFGSMLASTILSTDTTLLQGIVGFAVLVFLQYFITWLSVRSSVIQKLIKSQPTLLLYQGEFQYQEMKKARVPESEILAAIRANGTASVENIEAVVLETDGSFSVISKINETSASALKDVRGYDRVSRLTEAQY